MDDTCSSLVVRYHSSLVVEYALTLNHVPYGVTVSAVHLRQLTIGACISVCVTENRGESLALQRGEDVNG